MSLLADLDRPRRAPASGVDGPAREPSASRRLACHAAALAVVLFGLMVVLDNATMITADEGAVLSQAQVIDRTGQWGMTNPDPGIDPTGKWFGIEGSDEVGGRFYPYAKHAAYPAFASVLLGLGGSHLVLAASIAATLAAAVLAALLSRRLAPNLDIATLWVTGLASPLFFDGYVVAAYSIGASLAALTCYAVVRWWEAREVSEVEVDRDGGGPPAAARSSWRWIAVALVALVGAELFRSEGTLLGAALALTIGALSLARRDRPASVVAVLCGAVTVATWWVDGLAHSWIVGRATTAFVVTDDHASWLGGRLEGASNSLLRPQLTGVSSRGIVLFGVVAAMVVAAWYLRVRPQEVAIVRGLSLAGALGALLVLLWNWSPVPGLLVAFPLVPVGVMSLRSTELRSTTARLLAGSAVLYAGAVVATQYSIGGGMEWGGRFFHMVLPLAVPLLLTAVVSAARRVDRTTARTWLGSLAVIAIVLFVVAAGTIVRIHDLTGDLVDSVHDISVGTASARDARGPIVVANLPSLGRFAWRDAVRSRYLMVPPSQLVELDERLSGERVEDFVFAAALTADVDVRRFVHFVPDSARTRVVGDWHLYVMRRHP